MNKFVEKRNSLENYVREQIIGPGAYNKKYFFLKDLESSEYYNEDLSQESALQNFEEIIPEVPAYQYSSAILFPVTSQSSETTSTKGDGDIILENEEEASNTSADDENLIEDISSNIILKQQNYPNSFGISFVFNKSKHINNDLQISLCYRKYNHISKKKILENKIAILVNEYKDEIKQNVTKYLTSAFGLEEIDNNLFIYPNKIFKQDDIYAIDYELLNTYVREEFISVLKKSFEQEIVELKYENEIKYFGLEDGNTQLYSISDKKYSHTNVFTIFSDTISGIIQRNLENGIENYNKYKLLIRELEIYNQLLQITTDLKTIIKEKNSSSVWQSKKFVKEITLPKFTGKTIQREKRKKIDEKDKESLEYYVQYYNPKALVVRNIGTQLTTYAFSSFHYQS